MTDDPNNMCTCRLRECAPHPRLGQLVVRSKNPGCPLHGTFAAVAESIGKLTALDDIGLPEQ